MSTAHFWLAWREILAEVLDGFSHQENVSPPWLVNPETGRRLQLDLFYPDLQLAVHFVGAQPAARRRRVSDQEKMAEAAREAARRSLCRQHGVVLVTIDLTSTEPRRELDRLHRALSTLTRRVAHASLPPTEKVALVDRLAAARQRLMSLRERIRYPEDLDVFAEKWRDRETVALRRARADAGREPKQTRTYRVGMRVIHPRFGEGKVTAVRAENGDVKIEVDFVTAGKRMFLGSLVGDKLEVLD